MIPDKLHIIDFRSSWDGEYLQAFTKFSIQAIDVLTLMHFHIRIMDMIKSKGGECEEYFYLEYASSKKDVRQPADFDVLGRESTLLMKYKDVNIENAKDEEPDLTVDNHVVTVQLLAYDSDGNFSLAIVNSFYRYFTIMWKKALDMFPANFIFEDAPSDDEMFV